MTNLAIILTIQQTVEDFFELPRWSTDKKTRKREIIKARQITHFFSKKYTPEVTDRVLSFLIGNCDRSTLPHSVKTVKQQLSVDQGFIFEMEKIDELIKMRLHDKSHILNE